MRVGGFRFPKRHQFFKSENFFQASCNQFLGHVKNQQILKKIAFQSSNYAFANSPPNSGLVKASLNKIKAEFGSFSSLYLKPTLKMWLCVCSAMHEASNFVNYLRQNWSNVFKNYNMQRNVNPSKA